MRPVAISITEIVSLISCVATIDRPSAGDERVIGQAEHLATPGDAGPWEQPADPPVGVNEQQAPVILVGDQHVPWQRPRI